jgi:cytochrome c-type biogenesis protein CcmE
MSGFITSALWNWFLGWPWYAHVALAAGAVLFAWGALNGLFVLASRIGGGKAGWGAMLAVVGLVAALWPRKGRAVSTDEQYPHPDFPPKKKRRPTIFDR